jgi:hypothetical protein
MTNSRNSEYSRPTSIQSGIMESEPINVKIINEQLLWADATKSYRSETENNRLTSNFPDFSNH